MNLLKIENKKAYFILSNKEIEPEKLSKDDLVKILDFVFKNHDNIVFPNDDDFNSIVNPVEKEIVEQIIAKIKEFHTNVPSIDNEIKNQFPDLDYLISKEGSF